VLEARVAAGTVVLSGTVVPADVLDAGAPRAGGAWPDQCGLRAVRGHSRAVRRARGQPSRRGPGRRLPEWRDV